jgi:hypothetical protein
MGNLIWVVDQGVDGRDKAGAVAARFGRDGGSPEPGVAHAMGHNFH